MGKLKWEKKIFEILVYIPVRPTVTVCNCIVLGQKRNILKFIAWLYTCQSALPYPTTQFYGYHAYLCYNKYTLRGIGRGKFCRALVSSSGGRVLGRVKPETLHHRDDPLLYIAFVMLIWAAPITADRWHCSLWP